MRALLALVLATAVLATTITPAIAGGPPGSVEPNLPEPPAPTRTKRYGAHVFLADVAVLAAVGLVTEADSDGSGASGLVSLGYFAAAPLVHLHHGNPQGATKSLAARALLPVGGALAGMALFASDAEDGAADGSGGIALAMGMVLGAGVGALSAMVLDWTVFAKKTVAVKPAGFAVAPGVAVTKQSVSVGLAGRF